jgi:integrase
VAKGTVSKKKRAKGLTWIYRFQATRPSDGRQVEHTKVIGLVRNIGKSDADAWREVGRLGLDINIDSGSDADLTFRAAAEHFRKFELKKRSGIGARAGETIATNELLLDNWVLPRWGHVVCREIRPLMLEAWFESITTKTSADEKRPLEWTSVVKIRSIMSQVFKHAQRHELIPAAIGKDGRPSNPVLLARCDSSSGYEAIVVTPEQMIVILNELNSPETRLEWTLSLLHAVTALRPEESFGLKWEDIDWKRSLIHIRRGWSKGRETAGKNKVSMTDVAMHPALASALCDWRGETRYGRDSDWVFASDRAKGRKPRSAGVAGQDYLRPAAIKAGVVPKDYKGRFGWHNLRHSLATFFAESGVTLPIIQAALRHAKPSTTAEYTHRVNSVQLKVQEKFLEAIKVAKPAAAC